MRPRTIDEKQLLLTRVVRDLARLKADANNADCGMLAFLIAMATDEARNQLETFEAGSAPE